LSPTPLVLPRTSENYAPTSKTPLGRNSENPDLPRTRANKGQDE
jgi:hypothetical protein